MLNRQNPFGIVLWVFVALSTPLFFSHAPLETMARYALWVFLICAGLVLLIVFGLLAQYVSTHRPCPVCGQNSFSAIKRVESGLYDDGGTENPLAISFDADGNMYVRKYNRVCGSCKHQFYVDDGGWAGEKDVGKSKLVMTKTTRDRLRAECEANSER